MLHLFGDLNLLDFSLILFGPRAMGSMATSNPSIHND